MRKTYRKFKITFDAVFETTFIIFDTTFQARETSFVIFMINNAEVVTIIYFIIELRDVILRSGYNFRN